MTLDDPATRPRGTWLWVGAAGVVAAALVIVSTLSAIEVDEDAISYIAGAESLAGGHGYLNFDGRALTTWPPGLSAVLAVGDKLGIGPTAVALALNALCAAAIVVLAYMLVRRHTSGRYLPLIAAAVVAISPVLIRVEDVVASEPLFIALSLAFLVVHEDAVAQERWWPVVASGLLAGSAALVRWHGFALVGAGVTALLLTPSDGVRRRLERAAVFALGAGCLIVPVVVRNLDHGGQAFGVRSGEAVAVSDTLGDVADAVGKMVVPESFPSAVLWLTTVGVLVLAVAATVSWWWLRSQSPTAIRTRPLTTVAVSTLFLSLFAFGARLVGGTDLVLRTLSPVYVPALVLGFAWFDRARASPSTSSNFIARVVGAVFIVWAVLTIPRAVLLVRDNEAAVEGYSSDVSRSSALVAAVDGLPHDAVVFTNEPWPIWYADHARRPRLTASTVGGLAQPIATLPELRDAACTDRARMAVFGADVDPRAVLPRGSEDVVDFEDQQRVADGALFRIVPTDPSACASR